MRDYNNCEDLMLFWKFKFQNRIFTLDYDAFIEEPEIIGSNLFDFFEVFVEARIFGSEKK